MVFSMSVLFLPCSLSQLIMNARLTSVSPFIEDDRERDLRIRISTRKVDWGSLSMSRASDKGSLNNYQSISY